MTDFETWLYRVSGSTSQRSIAQNLGMQNTALSRWIRDERVPAERVIEIARHFNASIWDGLASAGYVTAEDISTRQAGDVQDSSTRQLLEELLRRTLEADELASIPERRIEEIVERVVSRKSTPEI